MRNTALRVILNQLKGFNSSDKNYKTVAILDSFSGHIMVTSQRSHVRRTRKLKTRLLRWGKWDILLIRGINIPSQWDNGVSLFAEA